MILTSAKMADIRQHSKNVQERDVIETLDAVIAEYKKALTWALQRVNYPALLDEGFGRYPDRLDKVKKLVYD